MKRIVFFATIIFLSSVLRAQTADDVINNYVKALGGAEKVSSIKTLKMKGALNVMGTDVEISLAVSHNVGYRLDIIVPTMDPGYQVITPTKGSSFYPFRGQTAPEEMSAEQVKDAQANLDAHGILFNYKEKGYKATLEGKEKLEGVECYKVKLESASGKAFTFWIDASTYYKIRTTSKNSEGTLLETTYSNYKKTADGYLFAFSQTNASGTVDFTSIEVNAPVDASTFNP